MTPRAHPTLSDRIGTQILMTLPLVALVALPLAMSACTSDGPPEDIRSMPPAVVPFDPRVTAKLPSDMLMMTAGMHCTQTARWDARWVAVTLEGGPFDGRSHLVTLTEGWRLADHGQAWIRLYCERTGEPEPLGTVTAGRS